MIESATPETKSAAKIKTHHNVGGLPKDLAFKLIEPLRYLFKDEARAVGTELGLPDEIVWRDPFPGPGLSVRVLGEVTDERLAVLREADAIFVEEIKAAGLYRGLGQVFAVLTDSRSTGVQGDYRTYGHVVALRAITTDDFMTADWARLPYEVLAGSSQPHRQRGAGGQPGGATTSPRSRRRPSSGSSAAFVAGAPAPASPGRLGRDDRRAGMKVLIVGSGAREHALAWCAARSPRVDAVVTAPGNAGTAALGENVPVDPLDLPALVAVARRVAPDLTVVGADDPLAAGAIDALQAAGLRAFGPTRAAAEIESSKVWSKGFMRRHGVPTAPFEVFDDAGAAHRFLDGNPWEGRLVVKADGLTRGKGVIVPDSLAEAHAALAAVMEQRAYGPGGSRVVIERRLEGPEASVFALCDGETAIPFGAARDHKRIFDGDRGPNTGGMGAYSPTRLVPAAAAGRGDGPRRPPGGGRPGRRGAPLHRLPLRRDHAHRRRAAGDRVQRPLRRPRGAGGAAPAGERPDRAARAGGRRAPGRGRGRRAGGTGRPAPSASPRPATRTRCGTASPCPAWKTSRHRRTPVRGARLPRRDGAPGRGVAHPAAGAS